MKSKKTEVPEMLLDFYRRELRRMIGMSSSTMLWYLLI